LVRNCCVSLLPLARKRSSGGSSIRIFKKFAAFFRTQYDAFGATVRQHKLRFE